MIFAQIASVRKKLIHVSLFCDPPTLELNQLK